MRATGGYLMTDGCICDYCVLVWCLLLGNLFAVMVTRKDFVFRRDAQRALYNIPRINDFIYMQIPFECAKLFCMARILTII